MALRLAKRLEKMGHHWTEVKWTEVTNADMNNSWIYANQFRVPIDFGIARVIVLTEEKIVHPSAISCMSTNALTLRS